jgi:hypothetical protein
VTEKLTLNELQRISRELIAVEQSSLGFVVTTPVAYSNGDCISVVVSPDGNEFMVHDAGLGSMAVAAEGVRIGKDLAHRFGVSASRYGCCYENGRVFILCGFLDLATSLMLVANASRAVADYTVEVRRQTEGQFRYAVTERLRELAGSRLRENENFRGASGRTYRVANVVLDAQHSRPMLFVLPLSSRQAVSTQFRELYDLRAALPDILNDSIYDEESDFRPDEDGWVLSQVGSLTAYSDMSKILPAHMGITLQ